MRYTDQELGFAVQKGDISQEEYDKLKGTQNVRNSETGQFAKETERFDKERVLETDKETPSPLARAAAHATAWLGLARSEEELNLWFADYILAGCELRGQRLRELTEAHLILAKVPKPE